tara:strand:- start:44 stop:256 length:213 start_codon:yes stop_codon:yes gene_type:complete
MMLLMYDAALIKGRGLLEIMVTIIKFGLLGRTFVFLGVVPVLYVFFALKLSSIPEVKRNGQCHHCLMLII